MDKRNNVKKKLDTAKSRLKVKRCDKKYVEKSSKKPAPQGNRDSKRDFECLCTSLLRGKLCFYKTYF